MRQYSMKCGVVVSTLTLLCGLWAPALAFADINGGTEVPVHLTNQLVLGYPLQDVFLQSAQNSTEVVRVGPGALQDGALLSSGVFAASSPVAHDYFRSGMMPMGPWSKGVPLQMTLRDWLAASGNGTYTTDNTTGSLELLFTGLVPFGTYSVWCNRITMPPMPSVSVSPCGASSRGENTFIADRNGTARFTTTLSPLPQSSTRTATAISVVYHSDGVSRGDNPGSFGLTSHEQLMFLFPAGQPGTVLPPPPTTGNCMQTSVTSRDNLMSSAAQTYQAAVMAAIDARRTGLTAAWGMDDRTARNKEINGVWRDYVHARNFAKKMWLKTRHDTWKMFGNDRAVCHEPRADKGREALDQ